MRVLLFLIFLAVSAVLVALVVLVETTRTETQATLGLFLEAVEQKDVKVKENASAICASLHEKYTLENKELAYANVQSSTGGVGLATFYKLEMLNNRISQLILLSLMNEHGCSAPTESSSPHWYYQPALNCWIQELADESAHERAICDREKWLSIRPVLDYLKENKENTK